MTTTVLISQNGMRWILPSPDAKIPGVNLTYRKLVVRNAKRRVRKTG